MQRQDRFEQARRRARWQTVAMLTAALAGAIAYPLLVRAAPATGATAPDFVLKGIDGRNLRLSEYRGDTVVLSFWASWCGPCLEEMPDFIALQRRYAERGVQFLGVAVEDAAAARALATRLSLNYPSMVGDLEAMDIARRLGNTAGVLPYTVLIGPDGKVLARLEGRADRADLARWLSGERR
jgi:peroxiredoxin